MSLNCTSSCLSILALLLGHLTIHFSMGFTNTGMHSRV